MRARGRALCAALIAAGVLLAPAGADAQLPPPAGGPVERYGENDAGGFRNVLPPGSNGLVNAPDFARYESSDRKDRPRHSSTQLPLYDELVFGSPEVGGDIAEYFKDATFGIKPGDVQSATDDLTKNQNPCPGATTLRDKEHGVPRVYASTRAAAMCALGYVAAEDRLFLIDVLRNAGRAQLTTFIGGAEGNQEMDEEQWRIAPYTEADLEKQLAQLPQLYGEEGEQGLEDVENYVLGINKYILEAKAAPAVKMPVEYAAINRPQGPDPWRDTDLVATASLVGGIFGKGGGRELDLALMLQEMQERFEGAADPERESQEGDGREVFDDFRRAEDEEAPVTTSDDFPYQEPPGEDFKKSSSGVPDAGSVEKAKTSVVDPSCQPPPQACSGTPPGSPVLPNLAGALSGFPSGASNALLVSGSETNSGRPQTVFGPQTGYFAPQILMEQEVHAPTLDARGAAFPGVNLYVQLGRGRDYAWSATSAGQDITDTYAVDLCGGKNSNRYRFRGRCEVMEELVKENPFNTNASDPTVGAQTLRTQRTKLGLVVGRGEIDGDPVAYTQLRSTYYHEIDSARGFSDFNDPGKIRNLDDYQKAAAKIGYTFNWFYTDAKKIGYFNSGNNPERPKGLDHNFPVRGKEQFEWRGFEPLDNVGEENTADYTPFDEHPQADDPEYLTSWNNKQAPEYRAADDNLAYGSVHRSEPLDDRILEVIEDGEMQLDLLVDAMEDAATVDLRGDKVLPWALEVIGENPPAEIEDEVEKLRDWEEDGAHRRDRDEDGEYEHSDAVALMDAWWPDLLKRQFEPTLGEAAYEAVESLIAIDDPPNTHQGSSYIAGWYSFAEKDLRTVLEEGEGERASAGDEPEEEGDDDEAEDPDDDDTGEEQDGDGDGDEAEGRSAEEGDGTGGGGKERGSDDEVTAEHEPDAGEEGEPDVEDPYSRIYCGGTEDESGDLEGCRDVLVGSLESVIDEAEDQETLYEDEVCEEAEERPANDQVCFDAILFTPAGAVEQPLINWQNRPTFQQVVEVLGEAGRGDLDDDRGGSNGRGPGGGGNGEDGNGGNGFERFPPGLAPPPACLPASLKLGRLRLGPAALAASPLTTLLGAGVPTGSERSTFRYCRTGGGELLVAFSSFGRARLIASTARGDVARGIGPGDARSALRDAFPDAVAVGPGLYRAGPSSRLVFGVSRGRVRFLGLGDRRLLGDRAALADHVERLGL